jgi:hypothetical protein
VINNQQTRLPAFILLSKERIAARAYELYLKRGAADGFDRDDWFRAQQELRARGIEAERRRRTNRH